MESICADAEEQAEGAEFFILTLWILQSAQVSGNKACA